jgi:hypothetical protein
LPAGDAKLGGPPARTGVRAEHAGGKFGGRTRRQCVADVDYVLLLGFDSVEDLVEVALNTYTKLGEQICFCVRFEKGELMEG